MEKVLTISTLILGSVIGAGFASGQEIKIFFTNFGTLGFIGLIIAIIIIVLAINLGLKLILKNNTNNYDNFLVNIFQNNKILSYSMKNIITIFLFASFLIMGIGFASCLEQQFGIPRYVGGTIIAILCYITFIGNINRILKINKYIMPVLVALILMVGIDVFLNQEWKIQNVYDKGVSNFIFSSFIYASYNIIPLFPILVTLGNEIKTNKQINVITVISFILICIPAIAIYIVTCCTGIGSSEILLVEATNNWGIFGKIIFSLVILSAIYTSAICSGYGFTQNISKTEKGYKATIIVICLMAIVVSSFSFATTVQVIYPIFGLLGLIQIFFLIKVARKNQL